MTKEQNLKLKDYDNIKKDYHELIDINFNLKDIIINNMQTIQNKLIGHLSDKLEKRETTLEKTATATGISVRSLYRYRKGKRIMNVEQYTALQTYLNNLNK